MGKRRDGREKAKAPAPSGEFSQDPTFDPAELFEVLASDENVDRVTAAIRQFQKHADDATLARAIAVYVRSARTRGEPIERVLGALESAADRAEGTSRMGFEDRNTPLRRITLRGVLLAFYGSDVVEREAEARRGRSGGSEPPRRSKDPSD